MKKKEHLFDFILDSDRNPVYDRYRDFVIVFLQVGGLGMDYKEMIRYLVDEIEDNKVLESLFYIIQKIIGRGI